ncbi:MAG TPA: glycosyltransferase family 2 protein [Catalimonadaceae bacterium]|nr:glycosyltransferase family 2 protein [Catalimonadaceae bacterium]
MSHELSIIIPCLNEARTIEVCVKKAHLALTQLEIDGEVIVADNGSTDGSQNLAESAGAKVVAVTQQGYGAAIQGGVLASSGQFIIMGDGDDSYNFLEIKPFVEAWKSGSDFVLGNRFKGGIEKDAMPFLHQYLGNPVLSFVGRLFFSNGFGDFHCGMRGFTREAFNQMQLTTGGMEFASEMVVKASLLGLKSTEVPVRLYKDGRGRAPHLNTWTDGWRHLRFLLLFSPRWLFFYPGLLFVFIGLTISSLLLRSVVPFQSLKLDVHTLLYSSTLTLIGVQLIAFYILSQAFARREGLSISSGLDLSVFKLEYGLLLALCLFSGGIWLSFSAVSDWRNQEFGQLNPQIVLRKVIPAISLILLAFQGLTFSFFLSFLQIKRAKNPE